MLKNQEVKISINLVPPDLYDPYDLEWQEICENVYYQELNKFLGQDKTLKQMLAQNKMNMQIDPIKVEKPTKGLVEIFTTLVISFGGTAGLLAALKYLFDKLIELQKDREETKRAREFVITVGEKTVSFKAMDLEEALQAAKQLGEVLGLDSDEMVLEIEHD